MNPDHSVPDPHQLASDRSGRGDELDGLAAHCVTQEQDAQHRDRDERDQRASVLPAHTTSPSEYALSLASGGTEVNDPL